MEIGKRGIWSHEQMFEARPDVMYEKIAADTMMDKDRNAWYDVVGVAFIHIDSQQYPKSTRPCGWGHKVGQSATRTRHVPSYMEKAVCCSRANQATP